MTDQNLVLTQILQLLLQQNGSSVTGGLGNVATNPLVSLVHPPLHTVTTPGGACPPNSTGNNSSGNDVGVSTGTVGQIGILGRNIKSSGTSGEH